MSIQDTMGDQIRRSIENQKAQAAAKEAARVAELKAQGLNADGSPIRPDRVSLLDQNGNLDSKYQLQAEELDPTKLEGYNMIKTLATQTGPSQYAQEANKLAEVQKQDTMDAGVRQAASANAAAVGNMAMRGGASSGSRERMGYNMQNALLNSRQDANRGYTKDLLNIGLEDAKMKNDNITKFATAEGQIAQGNLGIRNKTAEYNMGNLLKEKDAANQWNMDVYNGQNAKWAAGEQAKATRAAGGGGGGGCFITTAVCEYVGLPDDNAFLNTFRKFRDEHMGGKNSLALQEYYSVAPKIVEYINGREEKELILKHTLYNYLVPAYFLILKGENDLALAQYELMFNALRNLAEV